ncbi:hypothetical protein ACFQ9V_08825 [Leifsonia sp. NPDC056665]|uniref:hypothetical protein n=1 Tax=Leifsonia sp. NPDC056665 TaxID=3345901 RepID=UPI0036A63307
MQTAAETTTAGFADLICSDSEWLEAEFVALVARARLEPPVRTGNTGPRAESLGHGPQTPVRVHTSAGDKRVRAVARYPPAP